MLYFNVYERLRKLEDMIENGELCDREEGVCKAHESYFDLVDENTTLRRAIEIYCTTYNDIRYFDFDVAIRKAKEEIGKKNKEEKESDL